MSTSVAPSGPMAGLIKEPRSTAQSEPAKSIDRKLGKIRRDLLVSYVIGNKAERAMAELEEVRLEANQVGWDGYGALPLNPQAYHFARVFINALPTTAPSPEVGADTDGEVSLDWIFGDRKALTVSIGPTGRCTYAWMLGRDTQRGTGWIEDEIPATIVFALGQLVRDAFTRCTS